MKKLKRFTAVLLSVIMLISLASCGGKYSVNKLTDFKDWFNLALVPAYDSFVKTDGAKNAAFEDISLMLASDAYINHIFNYIEDGTQPKDGEVTEENGTYYYKFNDFKQRVEFDTKKNAIKVTMLTEFMGETKTQFIAVFMQQKNEYFIQYYWCDFGELHEMRFTETSGYSAIKTGCDKLPYSIFTSDIPSSFAKES